MSLLLQDKKIVIIGGTTGLWFSAAKVYIKEGARWWWLAGIKKVSHCATTTG